MTEGINTGFTELDLRTGGLMPSELIVLVVDEGVSALPFLFTLASNVGVADNLPVAVFSHGMGREELVLRLLADASGIDIWMLQHGLLSMKDWPQLTRAAERISSAPIFINDSAPRTVAEIRAEILGLLPICAPSLVLIDNPHLFRRWGTPDDGHEVTLLLESLKSFAGEIGRPVFVACQNADLREPLETGRAANILLFLVGHETGSDDFERKLDGMQAFVAKQRGDWRGKVDLKVRRQRDIVGRDSSSSLYDHPALISRCFGDLLSHIERQYDRNHRGHKE